ncbi:bifunctional glutamate N-acetyltransferase/amino-acid acetyltransferase ArgJ [Pseudotabrizicola alkalilacus]|uniref:Arginine biosynthesis bifunctional protein ArgJ n=1 Tax=Pseudotabrizicola alkalilacus TaxID=2305252 RepID=A0A411Z2V1_9RHOB|nr:bifunctional glutamate N-acetyltransferase/amino-acid acetyltransferase ArgJ [Pseudotabrizicola alkalilacus]RGP37401.1 bifunctional glutamate N-acetyltransferase/amino-acid acetyltransferase ArgJ [Pseudotabrizicola alkalilacus]
MAKTDWKAEAKTLKKRLRKLKSQVTETVSDVAVDVGHEVAEVAGRISAKLKSAKPVSTLAPKDGFPTLPVIKGVEFSAAEAGIKYANRKDVMLIRLTPGTAMAGVFTRSSTRSGCVRDCQDKLAAKVPAGSGAAIIVNSGNSNAFTGKVGDKAVAAVTGGVAAALELPAERVFSSSTGVIGEPLPHEKITAVLPDLVANLREDAIEMAAHAMMTTDTFAKGAAATIQGDGGTIHIAGIAKGSGMIAPDMATMLVYIFTDAKISPVMLQRMLSRNVDATFNSITVDSDTSTSDTLLLAATGQSDAAAVKGPVAKAFETALQGVMQDLALQVIRDGEGATKLVEIRVTGATSDDDAAKVAFAIANSPLVKTALAGEDPNWGRIVAAIGKSGAEADRDRLTIRFGDVLVAKNGWRNPEYLEEDGAAHFKQDEILIRVDLGLGKSARTVWTCDLTNRYIEINADYRS